jgi:hypothetical protein
MRSQPRTHFPEGMAVSKDGLRTLITHSIHTLLADETTEEGGLVRPERFELPT